MGEHSRRALLRGCGLLGVALAGCSGDSDGTPTERPTRTPTPDAETVTETTVEPGLIRWQTDLGSAVESAPVVANGTVYVTADDLHALSADDGSTDWRFGSDVTVSSRPLVHGRSVYVGSGEHGVNREPVRVHAVSLDGIEHWQWTGDKGLSLLAATGETLAVGNHDDHMTRSEYTYGLSTADGSERWGLQTGDVFEGAASDGTLYVGGARGALYAVAAIGGETRWSHDANDYLLSAPHVGEDTVYLEQSGGLVALSASDGAERWRFMPRDNFVTARASIPDGIAVGLYDGTVVAFASDGTEHWRVRAGEQVRSVVADGGTVYASTPAGRILASVDGTVRWRATVGQDAYLTLGRDAVLALERESAELTALATDDGSERWHAEFDAEPTSPTVATETAYVSTERGRVYALAL